MNAFVKLLYLIVRISTDSISGRRTGSLRCGCGWWWTFFNAKIEPGSQGRPVLWWWCLLTTPATSGQLWQSKQASNWGPVCRQFMCWLAVSKHNIGNFIQTSHRAMFLCCACSHHTCIGWSTRIEAYCSLLFLKHRARHIRTHPTPLHYCRWKHSVECVEQEAVGLEIKTLFF